MSPMKDIIEWSDCGSTYSMYMKHFVDDEGKKGIKIIFEDETYQKVTEMVIPPRVYPSFLRAINSGTVRGYF